MYMTSGTRPPLEQDTCSDIERWHAKYPRFALRLLPEYQPIAAMRVPSLRTRLLLGLLALWTYTTAAAPSNGSQAGSGTNQSTIVWGSCNRNLSIPLLCATLDVPLDYTVNGSNASSLTLKLVKLPSARKPSRGSILINPGGPGIGGRNFMVSDGVALQKYEPFGVTTKAAKTTRFDDAKRTMQGFWR
jgi:hypothetical protein